MKLIIDVTCLVTFLSQELAGPINRVLFGHCVVAKRTSMFDDPAVEIQELTSVIKQDITALNSALSDLQHACDSKNEGANRTKHSSEHSTTVVDTLKGRLMNTTKEFKDVLTLRTEVTDFHTFIGFELKSSIWSLFIGVGTMLYNNLPGSSRYLCRCNKN